MSCIARNGSIEQLGGKAHALSRLELAGLAIPAWFAVVPDAFVRSLSPDQRTALSSSCREQLHKTLSDLQPCADAGAEIREAVAALGGARFAVRSSAVDEDGMQDSFAGQLSSYLFVEPEMIVQRVADVWRSGFTPTIMEYRRQRGLAACPCSAPAVLVQRMIDPVSAGVAFSADPVSGRNSVAIVSAVFGLGSALVGGDADADVYAVHRSGAIEKRTIANKEMMHAFCAQNDEGAAAVPVPPGLRDQPVLTDDQAIAVAGLARRAAAVFGRPQDIEWAIAEGRIYLLQSRPITTLRNLPDPEGVLNIWDNSNIIESYSGITTPLTFSFARAIYEGVYRRFCRILRVPKQKIDTNEQTFAHMLGIIQGRVYYNLLNWYRVLALLPGFTVNRRFMEQMMGVRESLPQQIADGLAASCKERFVDFMSLGRMIFALARNIFTLERQIKCFQARLDDALRPPSPPLSDMRLDELTAYYTQLEERLLDHWDAPLVNDFFAMIFHGALRKLTLQWMGDESGMLANDAIRGEGGMISAEPAARVRELARIAAADPQFVRCLCEDPIEEVFRLFSLLPDFRSAYESYLEKFGDRCLEELKLESETVRDNPAVLLRNVGSLASASSAQTAEPLSQQRNVGREAEATIRSRLARAPLKRFFMLWVLRNARKRVGQRENLRFERTRLFGRVRSIFREAGKRLHAAGVLSSPEGIFYLQVDEILAFVSGTAVTANLGALAGLRKAEFDAYQAEPAPAERFQTQGPVYHAQDYCATRPEAGIETAAADQRQGIGCCPGVMTGVVTVIHDPRNAQMPVGNILVAQLTDPGWIMLFPCAAGLLVERGSLLSHSAIVARELGIPAVVSIRGLTHWLHDGDVVELDGARGIVRRISMGNGHAE